ncbi:acyltransferase family protein [Sphaerisporangium viridialbum]|uniref:acyltransferase family protein n=1 Tax=Sphaerisporangium viridialbum TaxID=46189 RepID=UPI003C761E31
MRKDYIDWLRNIGILFLFPYHTARVFNEASPFYIKGEVNTFSSVLVHLSYWFMPLLFLLAGTSSFYALQRRSARKYVNERFSRLLVPLVFGVLVVVPPQAYYAMKFHLGHQGGYLEFLWTYFTDFSDWSEYAGGVSPAHLWFILFLFLISVALVLPMRKMTESGYSPTWSRHPLLILLPFAFLAALSFLPDVGGKNIFVYAGYFMLGFFIATNDATIDMLEKYRRAYLAAAFVGAAGVLIDTSILDSRPGIVPAGLYQLVCLVTLLSMLGYGKRHLNRRPKFLTYFNPAAFPVYILHQTYLIIVAYYVLQVVDHGIIPFLLIMFLSFGLSLATYDLVRRVNPARAVFGLARLPAPAPRAAERTGAQGR